MDSPIIDIQFLALNALANTADKASVPSLLDYLDRIKEQVEGSEKATVNSELKEKTMSVIAMTSGVAFPEKNAQSVLTIEAYIRQVAFELNLPEPKIRPVHPPVLAENPPFQAEGVIAPKVTARPQVATTTSSSETRSWLWIAGAAVVGGVLLVFLLLRASASRK